MNNPPPPAAPLRSNAIPTPAFVLDLAALRRNLELLAGVRERAGCRVLLAQKAFSMPAVYPLISRFLDGACASSVHEARLGREAIGGEVHVCAAAFSDADLRTLAGLADHITFNSFDQWRRFQPLRASATRAIQCGLRVNPQHSEGSAPLYDPCAPRSRLGVIRDAFAGQSLEGLSGLHFHTLCEHNADALERTLTAFEARFGDLLPRFRWVNFGGGHHITRPDYDVERLCRLVRAFRRRHDGLRVYLEPGEAVALNAGVLVATVLDVVWNEMPIAVLDASCACHTPDVLEMPYRPRVFRAAAWNGSAVPPPDADRGAAAGAKPHTVRLTGPSCLAGDVFDDYAFDAPLRTGDRLAFEDMAHYTMVKTTTFNGVNLPSIVLREPDGMLRVARAFGYEDFRSRLA